MVRAPGIIDAGITRVDSSSQLGIAASGAEIPGNGTTAERGAAAWPGNGTAAVASTVAAPGLTGKICWQVGHLMRAPPAGIFLSSMLRFVLQEGHATFMVLLEAFRAKLRRLPYVPHLSIVIPVYNEESIVESAAQELSVGLDARGWDYEIIFAENGSRDATPQILERMCADNPRLKWFHSATPNYGSALKQGIQRATGELVVCDEIDLCDLVFYDAAIPVLEAKTAQLVVGSKAAHGASDQRPIVRRLATRMHNGMLWVTLGFKGTDTHGLKAFRREALMPTIGRCVVDMDVFASEFVVRAWRDGIKVLEIPIQLHEKRQPSIHLFRRVPNVLRNVAKLVYVIRVRGQ